MARPEEAQPARGGLTTLRRDGPEAMREGQPGPRVLVVDDEESIIDLVATALRYEGFQVEVARSGRGALTAATSFRPVRLADTWPAHVARGKEVSKLLDGRPRRVTRAATPNGFLRDGALAWHPASTWAPGRIRFRSSGSVLERRRRSGKLAHPEGRRAGGMHLGGAGSRPAFLGDADGAPPRLRFLYRRIENSVVCGFR